MTLEESVIRLIHAGKGDRGRLEHILATIQKGNSLYTSDKEYLDKFLESQNSEENQQINTKKSQNDTTIQKETKSDMDNNVKNETIAELSENEKLKKEVHTLQDKIHVIEEHLKNQTERKMRKADAVAGVIAMAIGILMVVGGGAGGIDAMCFGQAHGTCTSDFMAFITGVAIFWIGMIPTIIGVRLIAKA